MESFVLVINSDFIIINSDFIILKLFYRYYCINDQFTGLLVFLRDGKAGQPAPRLAHKNAGRVGPPRKVIAG